MAEEPHRRIGRPPRIPRTLPVLPFGCNPTQRTLAFEGQEISRSVNCRRYDRCLDYAYRARWSSFSCESCAVNDPLTRLEERADLEGLAGVLREVFR